MVGSRRVRQPASIAASAAGSVGCVWSHRVSSWPDQSRVACEGEQLVVGCDGGQRPRVGRQHRDRLQVLTVARRAAAASGPGGTGDRARVASAAGLAGLDRDHVGGHAARGQRGADPGQHGGAGSRRCSSSTSINARVPAASPCRCAGGGPERLMGRGERPGRAGLGQRGRPRQRARLAQQDLQVVVQLERLRRRGESSRGWVATRAAPSNTASSEAESATRTRAPINRAGTE